MSPSVEQGAYPDDIEPDGVEAIKGMLAEESLEEQGNRLHAEAELAAIKASISQYADEDVLIRREYSPDDLVQGRATPGWYASWHPDEVYYRTSTGVWMTSHFTVEEGSPRNPLHKLGPIYEKHEQSNLVDHARRELELLGEEHMTIDAALRIIQAFADMGHSGASASFFIPMIHELLQFHNLRPLTDDPHEWMEVGLNFGGTPSWQSRRRPDAFSTDGGKTYTLLDEAMVDDGHGNATRIIHGSQPHQKEE